MLRNNDKLCRTRSAEISKTANLQSRRSGDQGQGMDMELSFNVSEHWFIKLREVLEMEVVIAV